MALTKVSRGLLSTSIVDNGNATAITIDSSENVGIGTGSPSSYPVAKNLVVDAGTSGGITIKSGTSHYGGVFFADGTTGNEQYRGFVQYNHNHAGSTDALLFGTAGTTCMRIDSSGNVGIGVSSLNNPLEVGVTPNTASKTSGSAFDGAAIRLNGNLSTTNSEVSILAGADNHIQAGIGFVRESANDWGSAIKFYTRQAAVVDLDGVAERMRIDSAGNLLVGQTSAGSNTVGTSLRSDGRTFYCADGNYSGHFNRKTSDGDIVHFAKDDTIIGSIGSNAAGGTPVLDISANSSSGIMRMLTSGTERMRIDASGNLLVGETGSNPYNGLTTAHVFKGASSSSGAAPFGIYSSTGTASVPVLNLLSRDTSTDSSNRFLQFYANVTSSTATAMGGIVGNGASNVQFASISDVREKTNIESINGSLDKIKALNPVEFDWITSGEHCKAGFIAQEVEEVFPEFVVENMASEGQEERKGLTGGMTGGIVAHLVKAIQEQQTLIESLTTRIAALEE